MYKCVVCGEDLFTSDTKFESGSGWPSFYDVLEKGKVKLVTDNSMFMTRTEVVCAQVNICSVNKVKMFLLNITREIHLHLRDIKSSSILNFGKHGICN